MTRTKLMHALAVVAATVLPVAASAQVDPNLPEYEKASGVTGNFSSVGSDTLANLMTLWSEDFKKLYPSVNIQIQAAGSSTAPPALTQGTSQFGPMSRKMKDGEIQAFEEKYGYKPTRIRVAIDALAVFAHKDNPIESLTMPQVDAIFSANRKCGYKEDVVRWGQLGLGGELANANIQLYGRNSVSGTYGMFKEFAMCKGDFKKNVNEQPGSASVVQSVSASLNSLGYSGIGYITSNVKAVPLTVKDGIPPVTPTPDNAVSGKYPLTRYLYIYINKAPNQPLPPLVKEFMKLVLSRQGQEVVVKDGYVPLPSKVVQQELKLLEN